ncbi:MAG TPA: sigma-70 family RNA polymerase sigma factor [Bacteroidales bacterium]|nr:sigma-70 family RNA polymerase sigma factor [Bacteroidales bacterium]
MVINESGSLLFKIPKRDKYRSDEELISHFTLSGDLDLLGDLYTRYMPLVYGVCLKYLKNREESSDAVMQIFEKLISEIPKQRIENFRSWLHVVTKNYCLMQLRSEKSKKERFDEWLNDPVIFMENSYSIHPIDEDRTDIDKKLSDCIDNLKKEQKECILLFYFENKCYKEIASTKGLDENKVKSYLQNAKRNLKICLEEKNEQEQGT